MAVVAPILLGRRRGPGGHCGATERGGQIALLSEVWHALTTSPLTVLAVLYGVVTLLGVAFDLLVGDVLTPEVWVVVASILGMVLLLLSAIPTLPSTIPSSTGVVLSPLLLVDY